jgi:hypothetical protein
MWYTGFVVPAVMKQHTAFIFWIKPSKTCVRLLDPEEEGIMLL